MLNYDIHLKKLSYIHDQCASARKTQEDLDGEKNIDEFTRLRKKIASDIRSIKESIHERNQNNVSDTNCDNALAARQSHECRLQIRTIGDNVEFLSAMQRRRAKAINKMNNPPNELVEKAKLEFEIVGFAKRHHDEIVRLERFGDDVIVSGLFCEDDNHDNVNGELPSQPSLVSGIPDIDDPQFKTLARTDAQLNQDLDDILAAVNAVKVIAEQMNGELKVQEEIITNISDTTEQVEQRIVVVNSSLKSVLKKVRGPKEFFCDILLCLVILGIGCASIYLLIKK